MEYVWYQVLEVRYEEVHEMSRSWHKILFVHSVSNTSIKVTIKLEQSIKFMEK